MDTTTRGDRAAIVDAITNAITSAPRSSHGYSFISAHNVGDSVAKIEREIEREELIIKLFESDAVRDVFRKFDGKIINKRIWSALCDACYAVAPGGEPFKRYDGEIVKPCVAWIAPGVCYGDVHFCRVYVRNSDGALIYGRSCDWVTCKPEDRTEYQIKTGERLDAWRALAVLDYEIETRRANVAKIRTGLESAPALIADYLTAMAAAEKAINAFPCEIRLAFEIGERSTIPCCIHA